MNHVFITRTSLLIATLLCCATFGAPARAEEPFNDVLSVKGDTLRGRVVGLTDKAVEFRTVYGDGDLSVPYEDVEALETEGDYQIVFGDGEETSGRLLGVRDGHVLVGEDADSAASVPIESIRGVALRERFEESFLTRLRARFPYWAAELDLGFEFDEGAVDKSKVKTRLRLDRRLKPTRFFLDVDYAFDIQQKRDGPEVTTKNELFSMIRFDHDLPVDRLFALGMVAYEFDTPRRIDLRTFPMAGLGYRLFQREDDFVSVVGGFGWVYEKFDDFPDNDYAAAAIGLEAEWSLPRGARIRGGALYMPGLADIGEDWLFRWDLELTVPIWDPISMRFRMREVNDNNPTPQVGSNKFTTTLALSLQF